MQFHTEASELVSALIHGSVKTQKLLQFQHSHGDTGNGCLWTPVFCRGGAPVPPRGRTPVDKWLSPHQSHTLWVITKVHDAVSRLLAMSGVMQMSGAGSLFTLKGPQDSAVRIRVLKAWEEHAKGYWSPSD